MRVHDVNRLMAALESIFYEWEQDPILFFGAIEESADMTRLVELGASKRNGSRSLLHRISPTGYRAAPQMESDRIRMHYPAPKCPISTLVLIDTFVQSTRRRAKFSRTIRRIPVLPFVALVKGRRQHSR